MKALRKPEMSTSQGIFDPERDAFPCGMAAEKRISKRQTPRAMLRFLRVLKVAEVTPCRPSGANFMIMLLLGG